MVTMDELQASIQEYRSQQQQAEQELNKLEAIYKQNKQALTTSFDMLAGALAALEQLVANHTTDMSPLSPEELSKLSEGA